MDGPPAKGRIAPGIVHPGGSDRDHEPAIAGLVHDIDVTRFDTRLGRLIPLGLAGLVGVIAANAGVGTALVAGAGFALALIVTVVATERDRWHAQDVFQWYQRDRLDRWIRATGNVGPLGDPAAAEIWLGAHQPGSVPQLYRALAAHYTRDSVVIQREVARLPEASTLDRAWKEWLVQTSRLNDTGTADPAALTRLVGALPPSADRSLFQSWLATVAAAERRLAGDRDWIQPLADERSRARRTPLGLRRRARIWVSRFAVLVMFAVPAVVLSSIGAAIAERGDAIPPEYAQTTYAIRGDLPGFDEQRVVRLLPALARALPGATHVGPALAQDRFDIVIGEGLPTIIWTTGAIEVPGPSDATGRRVWELEFPLGPEADPPASVIVTLDGAAGPRYLYAIDPAVVARLRAAVGLGG